MKFSLPVLDQIADVVLAYHPEKKKAKKKAKRRKSKAGKKA